LAQTFSVARASTCFTHSKLILSVLAMAKQLQLLVFVLFLGASAEMLVIPPAYIACVVTVCGITGPIPVGGPAICAAALLACACFNESTVLTTPNGTKPITMILPGEEVSTADPVTGRDMWTRVLRNNVVEGHSAFKAVTVHSGNDQHTLAVTENHVFIRLEEDNYNLVTAAQVSVGDMVRHARGLGRVERLSSFVAPRKYDLATDDCTVLANGVLTTTSCENKDRRDEFIKHDATGGLDRLVDLFSNLSMAQHRTMPKANKGGELPPLAYMSV